MKTLKTLLFVVFTFFIISCSKKDEDVIIPSSAFSIENNSVLVIPDASASPVIPGSIQNSINILNQGFIKDTKKVTIQLDLEHSFSGDLIAILTTPNGNQYTLLYRTGVDNQFISGNKLNFNSININFIIRNLAKPNIETGNYYPTANNYNTFDAINSINNGFSLNDFLMQKNVSGLWKLKISDNYIGDTGKLIAWKLIFEDGWDR